MQRFPHREVHSKAELQICRSTCADKVDAFLGLVTFWPVSKCHMSFANEEAHPLHCQTAG